MTKSAPYAWEHGPPHSQLCHPRFAGAAAQIRLKSRVRLKVPIGILDFDRINTAATPSLET